jgi:tetratricopeptide (TPR) repeat protein
MRESSLAFPVVAACAVALVAVATYASSVGYELVWDDPLLLGSIAEAANRGGLGAILTAPFQLFGAEELRVYFRPVVLLSLWGDQTAGGGAAWTFHATNVLLHALVSVLCFTLFRAYLSSAAALAAALLFAVHPVHTESVAFVSGRTDVWAALFVLIAAACWVRVRHDVVERRVVWFALGGGALFLALLSKEVAFVLPGVLLVWDRLDPRPASPPLWFKRNAPWLLSWGIAIGGALAIRTGVAGVGFGANSASASPLLAGGLPFGAALCTTYARLLLLPWPLFAYYSADMLRATGLSIAALTALIGLSAAFFSRRRRRLGALALVWMAGFLLPVSGVVPLVGAALAERHLYLPSIGFCLLLGSVLDHLPTALPLRSAGRVLIASIGLLFVALTIARSPTWRDDVTLYTHISETAPNEAWAHYNLGLALESRGRIARAERAFLLTVEVDVSFAEAHYNLGRLDLERKRPGDAVLHFEKAVEAEPSFSVAWNNLGVALTRSGRSEEALQAHEQAIAADPKNAAAHANLGFLYLRMGRRDSAMATLDTLRGLDPAMAAELDRALTQ